MKQNHYVYLVLEGHLVTNLHLIMAMFIISYFQKCLPNKKLNTQQNKIMCVKNVFISTKISTNNGCQTYAYCN